MKRISEKDFDYLAEYIREEHDRRKKNRKHLDHAIKEIDRQISMRPDTSHKMIFEAGVNTGRPDPDKTWMPEIELPLQAEAQETLLADTSAIIFPDAGSWFTAHSATTDEYLDRADFTSMVAGDENEIPTKINQDNADKLVVGQLEHFHRQYRFKEHVDLILTEAISYTVGVGRGRMVKKSIVAETPSGPVRKDQMIPMLVPVSIKNTLLDDREHILQREGYMVGPLQIFTRKMQFADLKKMVKGDNNPENENGGWISKFVNKLEPDDKGFIDLIEAEGDFLIPRKTSGSIHLPNAIVTIASGKNENKVVRIRYRKLSVNSTIVFPYHRERMDTPYASSPLMKGWPLQAAATEMLMQVIMAAQLNVQPPVGYDRNDMFFAENGGPIIAPGALWGTIGDTKPHKIGDIAGMLSTYQHMLQQYQDVVGVHRARLGAQTVSHTTAYAKNAELQRGATRTVDFARDTLKGPLTQWLNMEYELAKKSTSGGNTFYVDAYRSFVDIEKDQLPDIVTFEAHGSGAPVEEQQKIDRRLAALAEAIQMDQIAISQGLPPTIDIKSAIEERLREGGWVDTDPLMNQQQEAAGQTAPPVSLQALAGIGGG